MGLSAKPRNALRGASLVKTQTAWAAPASRRASAGGLAHYATSFKWEIFRWYLNEGQKSSFKVANTGPAHILVYLTPQGMLSVCSPHHPGWYPRWLPPIASLTISHSRQSRLSHQAAEQSVNENWSQGRPRGFGHPKHRKQGASSTLATRSLRELPPPSLHWAFRIKPGLIARFSTAPSEVKGEEKCGTLTTSMFVILARRSVSLSPSLSWRPQMAAPTLPVAIIDGGYMAKLKSARTDLGISPSPDQKSCKTSEASNIKKPHPRIKNGEVEEREKCHSFWSSRAH